MLPRDNELVDAYQQVVANVKQYNADLDNGEDVVTQVRQVKHWYYIPELGMFGPSKYVGYKDMTSSFYNRGHRLPGQTVKKDGRDTEPRLSMWFRKLHEDEMANRLRGQLNNRLATLGRSAQMSCWIHIPK